jgi:hypothetical protein
LKDDGGGTAKAEHIGTATGDLIGS